VNAATSSAGAGGDREAEHRRARAERDDIGPPPCFLESSAAPTSERHGSAHRAYDAIRSVELGRSLAANRGKGAVLPVGRTPGEGDHARRRSLRSRASSRMPSANSRARVIALKYCRKRKTSITAQAR